MRRNHTAGPVPPQGRVEFCHQDVANDTGQTKRPSMSRLPGAATRRRMCEGTAARLPGKYRWTASTGAGLLTWPIRSRAPWSASLRERHCPPDRCLDELMGAVDQRDEVALAHAAPPTRAAARAHAWGRVRRRWHSRVREPGRMAISPATDRPPERRPLNVTCGVIPGRPQVRPSGGRRVKPASASKRCSRRRPPGLYYLVPGRLIPFGVGLLVTFGDPAHEDLGAEAEPVHQPRGARDAVGDV